MSAKIEHRLEQAEGFFLLEMFEEALKLIAGVLQEDPKNFQAYYLRGECYRAMKNYHQALPEFQQARGLKPQEVGPYIGIGWCYKRLGKLEEASRALEDYLKLNPNMPLALYNLSCYYALQNKTEQALRFFKKATVMDRSLLELARRENDFTNLRSNQEFLRLLESNQATDNN